LAEKSGQIGAVYAAYGDGIQVNNETVILVAGVKSLANSNVIVSKVTSDGAGNTIITKKWYCTVAGSLVVESGGTGTVYVTYKYWNDGVYAHKDAIDWTASTSKDVGDKILPTTPNDYYYEVAAGDNGDTGGTEPVVWGTTVGGTTVDGTVTWTCHSYSEVGQVCGFFNWGTDKVCDMLETTDFCDDGHRTYIANLKGWTGSAERHWLTEEALEWENTRLIIKFYIDDESSPKLRYEGWAEVTGHSVNSAIDVLVNETLTFQGNSVLNYENS